MDTLLRATRTPLSQKPSNRYSQTIMPDQPTTHQQQKAANTKASLLGAAAEVVKVHGVANLTLERVAETAGVSKGGLLYHFASKQELVLGMLTNTLGRADVSLNTLADENGLVDGAFTKAYLDYVRTGQHDEVDSGAGVFAAAAVNDGDLAPAQDQFAEWQRRLINDDGVDPTAALLARIVGDGLWLIDLFGLAPPTQEQRDAVCELVERTAGIGAAHST